MFNTVVVFRENKLTYGLCLAWKFKMIANGVSKFLLFSPQLAITWLKLSHYSKNELIAFPKIEI